MAWWSTGSWLRSPLTSRTARAGVKASTTPLHEPVGLEVLTAVADGQAVLSLAGELDCHTVRLLRKTLDELDGQAVPRLVFDLARLSFIDSSGLHQLVVALSRQRERGGDVVLQAPTPQTKRVLDIVGLSQIFTVV